MKGIKNLKQRISQTLMSFAQDFAKGIRIGIGFLFIIGTAGIFAVAVTGTFNTFTSGSVMKAADINANFASLKAAIEGIPTQKAMRLIYETDVTSATTSVNITGLDGDSDGNYEIVARFISGTAAASVGYFIRPNGDATFSNYIQRYVGFDNGSNPSKGVDNNSNGLALCGTLSNGSGGICFGRSLLYAKSGFVRTTIGKAMYHSSSTAWFNYDHASVYLISGTNITNITILSDQSNGIGAGSRIEVWAKR